VTKAAIISAGLKLSDVQLQPVGIGAPAFRALTTGQVDALNLWNSMHASLERTGFKIRRIPLGPNFTEMPSHGLIATNKMIENEPELLGKFGRAWAKSELACAANLDGCLKALYKHYPQTKPNMPLDQAVIYDRPILEALNTRLLYFAPGQPERLGSFTDNDWKLIIDALSAGEEIEKTDVPYEELYTNAFVGEYNDFDRAAVEERARSFR
jgi:NitT/TauT family transport system substrate-binding protein